MIIDYSSAKNVMSYISMIKTLEYLLPSILALILKQIFLLKIRK